METEKKGTERGEEGQERVEC